MRIMIWIGHPKQVHFWKNSIINFKNHGHEVKILAVKKDILLDLLNAYGFEYEQVGENYDGILKKIYGLIKNDIKSYLIAKKFSPDILVSGISLSHVSRLIGKPHISFTDTETAVMANSLTFPFTNVIITPGCYTGKIDKKKHVTFNGFEEMAYLHPNYFHPDISVLKELNINPSDKFIVFRFVAWKSVHDTGEKGIKNIEKIITSMGKYAKIFISSEKVLPPELEVFRINLPPEKIHHLMYYASLYFGESPSMATESALLGTPSIYIASPGYYRGYIEELEKSYKMLYTFNPMTQQEEAIEKAIQLITKRNIKMIWAEKREKLFDKKIDVTKFLTEFIEDFPNSFVKYKI